jgi:hypothetical protein
MADSSLRLDTGRCLNRVKVRINPEAGRKRAKKKGEDHAWIFNLQVSDKSFALGPCHATGFRVRAARYVGKDRLGGMIPGFRRFNVNKIIGIWRARVNANQGNDEEGRLGL